MWLPDWLYERLPFVYIASALWCLWALGESFAKMMSVFLLIGAAVVTYLWRRQARREEAEAQAEEALQKRQVRRI